MRILTVGNMYPPHHLGGYELVWQAAVEHLRRRGHDARVLTTGFRVEDGPDPLAARDVHRDLRWYWNDHGFPHTTARQRIALERHNARVFDRHLRDLRPEAISWWSMGGMSLSLVERARRAGVPSVACVHDDWLVYGPRVDAWLATFAGRPRLARATAALTGIPTTFDADALGTCLFVSETTRRRALAGGARPRKTEVAPSGIEDRFLEPGPVTSWRWRLLYVGRIDRRKGIDTAVEAVARLPGEARLTVVGEGEAAELEALREEARAAGVAGRVEFAGARPREELPALYAAHDAILFPVRWDEPWGLVPLEAMGIGRPVVATGQGGSAEYLRHEENALLFEAGDPDALAAAVTRLARDDSLRARLRAGGERTARAHTEAVFNRRVEEAIAEAVRRAARQ